MMMLRNTEQVLREVRRHWYRLFSEILFLLALAFVPLFLLSFLIFAGVASDEKAFLLFLFGSMVWLLCVWIGFFIAWTDHYLDVWIITNERIIDIEQKGLFSRDVSECPLRNVQDIRVEAHGLIASFLNFGDITVQTAGEAREFVMRQVGDPHRVKEHISALAQNSHKQAS